MRDYTMAGAKSRQPGDSSKKDWILRVWREMPNPTTKEVAFLCECDPAYVRVVVRQRKGAGVSDNDRAYLARFKAETGMLPGRWRYWNKPKSRRKMLANFHRWYHKKKTIDPTFHRARNAKKRQWIIENYGSEWKYKCFLTRRKLGQKMRV